MTKRELLISSEDESKCTGGGIKALQISQFRAIIKTPLLSSRVNPGTLVTREKCTDVESSGVIILDRKLTDVNK